MKLRRRLLGLALALVTSEALATPQDGVPDVDIVGPVRVGWGYSRLFESQILSLSFEDEVWWHRISPAAHLGLVFGMDAQRALDDVEKPRSFLATGIGPSLLLRPDAEGPGFVLSGTAAPLWQSRDDQTSLAGFGVGARLELWPFYQSIVEVAECRRGIGATYVLSGLHVWGQARHDWLGERGDSYAAGLGIDLGRNLLLPILGALLDASCANPAR